MRKEVSSHSWTEPPCYSYQIRYVLAVSVAVAEAVVVVVSVYERVAVVPGAVVVVARRREERKRGRKRRSDAIHEGPCYYLRSTH